MKLLGLEKTGGGRFLKSYQLIYENNSGKEKKYEIVSHSELESPGMLGKKVSGVSMCGFYQDKMLLLREFRMGVNQYIFNLCSGMVEEGETLEEGMARELQEETGLKIKRVIDILPPSFAAVAISDIRTQIAFVEVEGEINGIPSENEDIHADFYDRAEVTELINNQEFSSRAQVCAYWFSKGLIGADVL